MEVLSRYYVPKAGIYSVSSSFSHTNLLQVSKILQVYTFRTTDRLFLSGLRTGRTPMGVSIRKYCSLSYGQEVIYFVYRETLEDRYSMRLLKGSWACLDSEAENVNMKVKLCCKLSLSHLNKWIHWVLNIVMYKIYNIHLLAKPGKPT